VITRAARNAVLVASAAITLVGLLAGAVRVLPWLLDPAVPWPVAAPFARGLAAVAIEAALVVGWPIGWTLACHRLVETGEARVLQALGEPPHATVARLVPQGVALAVALGAVSLVYGSDASAPGRVATELVSRARASCQAARAPTTYAVPFTGLTWLCAPDREPRLVGAAPGGFFAAVLTASDARIAGDFRAAELDDARVLLPGAGAPATIHVGLLSLHGMAPWAHAATLSAKLRAAVLALTAWLAASLAAYVALQPGRAVATRTAALALGAAGPLAALGLMRLLERRGAAPLSFTLVPLAGAAGTLLAAGLLSRLRYTGRAASTWRRVH
jgi:hypothetical protein